MGRSRIWSRAAYLAWLLCSMLLVATYPAQAEQTSSQEEYPSRPVEMLVAYAPGGGQDMMFRLLARYAEPYMGQRIVVSNRFGGGNVRGKLDALTAAPDGYVLGTWAQGLVTDGMLRRDVPYSPRDVHVVCLVGMDPHVIAISKKFAESENIHTLPELLDYIRTNHERVTFGAGGNWTGHDFLRIKLEEVLGLTFVRLPFLGGTPALRAVAAGNCDIATPLLPEILSVLSSGAVIPLAVAHPRRVLQLPDVPTTAECGLPELTQSTWRAISVPKGTPKAIVTFLESVFRDTLADPKFLAAARKQGITPLFMGQEEATAFIAKEYEYYRIKTEEWGIRVQ